MRVTAYNTIGTNDNNRVVASYDVETDSVRDALQEATYRSCIWNKTEDRGNMRVNFVMAGGMVRPV